MTFIKDWDHPVFNPPIVLDLDGDGVDMISAHASSVTFDMDGDGERERTGWVGADDGLLVLDRNKDGAITEISEISFIGDLAGARTDMEGLRAFDSNRDGRFDGADERFSEFQVWQDRNSNGVTEAEELSLLHALGINSIDLALDATGETTEGAADNVVLNTAVFDWADGRRGLVGDVAFLYWPDHAAAPSPDADLHKFVQAMSAFGAANSGEGGQISQPQEQREYLLAASCG